MWCSQIDEVDLEIFASQEWAEFLRRNDVEIAG